MSSRIADYAVLGDTQSVALVDRDGAVDWLCLPRFDSPAVFAALLGDARHGRWSLRPAEPVVGTRRRYAGDTLVLHTEMRTATGSVRLIDFMPPRGQAPDLVRIVEGVSGRVRMCLDLSVRFDYGRVRPWLRRTEDGCAAIAGPEAVWLHTPVTCHNGPDLTTAAEFDVHAGQRVPFVLTWRESHLPAPEPVHPERALRDTHRYWESWLAPCTYRGRWRDEVVRSLITLKALTYAPTGGVVAAATTSLPEQIGGVRNWDYRYCWLRDATMTLQALMTAGLRTEAESWVHWLLRAIAGDPEDVQIMYGVAGERRLDEYVADWLPGYQGHPVRIGNAAVDQFQLDVYGEVMDCLLQARVSGIELDEDAWELQKALMRVVQSRWREPDDGIWEVRGGRQQFTHSKLMAWVAADRAVRSAERFDLDGPVSGWRALRTSIRRNILRHGYDHGRRTFTQFYGSAELDAAMLMAPMVGFLPASDRRVVGTVAAVERDLMQYGFVHRYTQRGGARPTDGLPPGEGAFLACSFWLADYYSLAGRTDQATSLFMRLLDVRNDLGLLSEEFDPTSDRLLGNFPQAFSHVPLINTARRLSRDASFVPESEPKPDADFGTASPASASADGVIPRVAPRPDR